MSQIDLEKAKYVLQERNNRTGQWSLVKGWTYVTGKTRAITNLIKLWREVLMRGQKHRHFRVRSKIEADAYKEGWYDCWDYLKGTVLEYDPATFRDLPRIPDGRGDDAKSRKAG